MVKSKKMESKNNTQENIRPEFNPNIVQLNSVPNKKTKKLNQFLQEGQPQAKNFVSQKSKLRIDVKLA